MASSSSHPPSHVNPLRSMSTKQLMDIFRVSAVESGCPDPGATYVDEGLNVLPETKTLFEDIKIAGEWAPIIKQDSQHNLITFGRSTNYPSSLESMIELITSDHKSIAVLHAPW